MCIRQRYLWPPLGNLVMEAILETKAETILQFIGGLAGSLQVTFVYGATIVIDAIC
jgi:hypothetical protein